VGVAGLVPALCLLALVIAGRSTTAAASQKTTQDKVYAKDQAERGGKQYATVCASCHDPEKVPAGKKPSPPLVGEKFLSKWDGRTLGELEDQIFTTMPNDGSATLTEDQTADLVAYILQANGMPDGSAALKYGAASKDIVIKK
jgi:mono/diheme cytochrome c family protein